MQEAQYQAKEVTVAWPIKDVTRVMLMTAATSRKVADLKELALAHAPALIGAAGRMSQVTLNHADWYRAFFILLKPVY